MGAKAKPRSLRRQKETTRPKGVMGFRPHGGWGHRYLSRVLVSFTMLLGRSWLRSILGSASFPRRGGAR